jgi:HEAT repeat protein
VEQVLLAAVRDKRPAVRETAVHILGLVGGRTATPALARALHDPVLAVQLQAIKALGRTHDPAAIPPLLETLHGANEQLGSQIAQALVNLGSLAVPALLKESNSHSAWVRWQCARVMGELCDLRTLPVLVRMLADSDYSVAWMAAKSLVHYRQDCLVPVLQLLMTAETSPWVADAGAYVLRNLYVHDVKLKPYLEPVVQAMHGVSYNIATPNAARKALAKLAADGMIFS